MATVSTPHAANQSAGCANPREGAQPANGAGAPTPPLPPRSLHYRYPAPQRWGGSLSALPTPALVFSASHLRSLPLRHLRSHQTRSGPFTVSSLAGSAPSPNAATNVVMAPNQNHISNGLLCTRKETVLACLATEIIIPAPATPRPHPGAVAANLPGGGQFLAWADAARGTGYSA